ncbi:MAG TPA: VOC family protein [Caulobacteraceae bacterium]|jgi:catechol 2,3-dioxygenase-like lactoylglutathione lyase family enzyme|nr:VOC family protein [Caulobacteraceae bacterium]
MSQVRLSRIAPGFAVADVFATAEYYRDVLGFRFDQIWGDPPSFVILDRDEARLMIKQVAPEALPTPRARRSNEQYDAFIYADDVTALAEELRSKAADIVEGPVDRPIYNGRELIIRDCDGRILCFGQLLD